MDVTSLFNTDVKSLGYPQRSRKSNKLTSMDTKLSYIESVKSYPENIEARHVKTYRSSDNESGFVSMELNNSMILLPKKPMKRDILTKGLVGLQQVKLTMGLTIKRQRQSNIWTDGD